MKPGKFATLGVVAALFAALPVQAHGAAGRHCVSRLELTGQHGRVSEARLMPIGCFATFAEAISAGSGGAVRVPRWITPASLTQAHLDVDPNAFVPLGSVMIGTEYDLVNYSALGSSHSYFATSTCSESTTWEVSYVTDTWNDLFSSGKGFGGCNTNKKFAASNFGGSVRVCTPNCSNYGSLSNEVSSLRWRP